MAAERDEALHPAGVAIARILLQSAIRRRQRQLAQNAGGRTPPGADARPHDPTDRTPDGTTPERRDIVPD